MLEEFGSDPVLLGNSNPCLDHRCLSLALGAESAGLGSLDDRPSPRPPRHPSSSEEAGAPTPGPAPAPAPSPVSMLEKKMLTASVLEN